MNLIQLQTHHHQHQATEQHLKLSMDHLTGLPISNGDMGSQGESSGRSTPNSDSAPGKLFVGGLSWQTSQDKLREYFGQFGNVTDVLVMKDPITQVSGGFSEIRQPLRNILGKSLNNDLEEQGLWIYNFFNTRSCRQSSISTFPFSRW